MIMQALTVIILSAVTGTAALAQTADIGTDWPAYGGDPGGTRYSPLTKINPGTIGDLRVAWTYRTGEFGQNARDGDETTFEVTPILFEGRLYLSTAFGKVIALDPTTGTEHWSFDPKVRRDRGYSEVTSRGVSAWRDVTNEGPTTCAARIFIGTIDARLIALDATDGRQCADFGDHGTVNLATAVGMEGNGDYQVTSPPAIVNGLVVVGSSIGDNWNLDTGDGVVRAFDAKTGELRWSWNPIPRDSANWRAGAANAWAPLAADPARDLVFVPTSSPSPDFYGGERLGDNRYANSLVAIRASTGRIVWSFQTVHHDLWDYDIGAQPALVTIRKDGNDIPAVVQATKMGLLFVFHRETGEPLFPIEERNVLSSDVPGETAHVTQPFPTLPRPLVPHHPLTPDDAWGVGDADQQECRDVIARYRSRGVYDPPSLDGTIMYPGNSGGTRWGGVAYDPRRNLVVLNVNRLGTLVQLIPRDEFQKARRTEAGYEFGRMTGARYAMKRRMPRSSLGLPCTSPPWGTLLAVNVATGEVQWEVPFGKTPAGSGLPPEVADQLLGWPSAGGPIVTASGLVFIAASFDSQIRAFDIDTGRELWNALLPRAGIATPMTYLANGRQYVVIAAGGHGKADLELGDFVIAFALPETQ